MSQVSKKSINVGGELVDLTAPRVMGILNLTPDSFYVNSRVSSSDEVLDRVGTMEQEGATFIDLGGYSTRPGAAEVSVAEEIERIESVIEPIDKYFPKLIISIDTFRSQVAKRAVVKGVDIVNDVSGGNLDSEMFETIVQLKIPYILMHMRGTPQTMNGLTSYNDLVSDVMKELKGKIDLLRAKGVVDLIIDPGFGFAKTASQNFELLGRLSEFQLLGYPVLAGLSRKATIYKTLNITAAESLNGTTVLNTIALGQGASILRVHDVKPAMEAVKLWMATKGVN